MPNSRVMELSGWGKTSPRQSRVYRPEKLHEVAQILSSESGSVLARGLGRSYGDSAVNDGNAVILDERLDRFRAFDPATGTLDCEAGASLRDIIDIFLPQGFFPAVTPGTKFVTVGGAIAADVHGKNHHVDGSIANFVDRFDLLIASGQVIRCSREENAEAFWATIGGMGLTGIILEARIRLRPVESGYVVVDTHKTMNLDQTIEAFASSDSEYQYSVAWIDCLASGASLGRSVLLRGNHAKVSELTPGAASNRLTPVPPARRSVPFNLPSFTLSSTTVGIFNSRYYGGQEDGRKLIEYDEFFYPLDAVENWNRIYGRRGFFQYQAVFPTHAADKCLRELMEKVSASRSASFLAVLKAMGPSSGGILSFPIPGLTLALDVQNYAFAPNLLWELDQIVLRYGGRVYLAKDACMKRETFHAMYPNLKRFNDIKSKLDPANRFSSSQARRLGIGGVA
jgi:decaprenylphospho-beta-D-ribofuranose 2-oxidase